MLTRELLSAFFDELEKIGQATGLIAPALLSRGARLRAPTALMKALPSPASLVKPSTLASKVQLATDAPAQIIAGTQPRMISRRALRPTMAVPALQPAQPALRVAA